MACRLPALVLGLVAATAPGLAAGGQPGAVTRSGDHSLVGRRIYNRHCTYCHGYAGDARTLAARLLHPPPRDFTALKPQQRGRAALLRALRDGRPGTAMQGFAGRLSAAERAAVVDFIRARFMASAAPGAAPGARYHTPENGWREPAGRSPATPFATGEVALDTPWESLSAPQRRGKRLYLGACVSCHDRARSAHPRPAWAPFAVSYPPGNYAHEAPAGDRPGSATPFELHERAPRVAGLTAAERRGEALYLRHCAHCHAEDGSGRNWVGSFLSPRPPDLARLGNPSRARLARVVRDGLPGTAMPAWRGVLGEAEIRALAAYVARAFRGAGDARRFPE